MDGSIAAGILDGLNLEQRQAVEHDAAPLLIIAGAGSGKTNTLAHRVAHLVLGGADPNRILLLTFSRRAAAEMKRRVELLVGRVVPQAPRLGWAGTFHAVGARLLRLHARTIGLDPAFTILDREDAADLLNFARQGLGLAAKEQRFPTKATCISIYSRAVNTELPLQDLLDEVFPWCRMWGEELRTLFGAYVEAKQRQNLLDYDDLLLYWAQMMTVPEIAAEIGGRFDHVLVDEYQDTNRLQSSILLRMKPDGSGLTVVGDDAQSIYSFRAATVRNILDFPKQFDPPARIVTLARNYRSTQAILAASNAVISLAAERYAKDLWSERPSEQKPLLVVVPDGQEQARYVAEQVLENREQGITLKSQAVLFRAGHHSAALELELGRRNIPFVKFGGLKFLDTAHVKDLLAVLRWATNPKDQVSGFRVLQLLPGIGPKTADRLVQQTARNTPLLEAIARFKPPASVAAHWPGFFALIQRLTAGLAGWPAEIEAVRQWYEPFLEQGHEDPRARKADLEQLCQIASSFASREQFLTDLTLDPAQSASDESGPPLLDEDYLILSTIHSAKGLEWTSVFVLNTVDGCIPADLGVGSRDEIEEERRLLYVAMTRAKDQLHLITPRQFFTHGQPAMGDRHVTAARTRFIPARLLEHFEQVSWPKVTASSDGPSRIAGAAIRERILGMWR
ncbi:ATP-dependent helicase [Dongia sedimenti]|uniref:DNA 3'-5' helicase n=1 Tax=Dongia sedimenti TaxID=3064282 RepID=A0ABU0YVI7_9PROT|nr:ATP-dependent helicase [Rhodospirillaceae bacterium R-7]